MSLNLVVPQPMTPIWRLRAGDRALLEQDHSGVLRWGTVREVDWDGGDNAVITVDEWPDGSWSMTAPADFYVVVSPATAERIDAE